MSPLEKIIKEENQLFIAEVGAVSDIPTEKRVSKKRYTSKVNTVNAEKSSFVGKDVEMKMKTFKPKELDIQNGMCYGTIDSAENISLTVTLDQGEAKITGKIVKRLQNTVEYTGKFSGLIDGSVRGVIINPTIENGNISGEITGRVVSTKDGDLVYYMKKTPSGDRKIFGNLVKIMSKSGHMPVAKIERVSGGKVYTGKFHFPLLIRTEKVKK